MWLKFLQFSLFVFFVYQVNGEDMKNDHIEKKDEEMVGSTAMTYDLSKKELLDIKYKSEYGNAEASFRLYQYYFFTLDDIDNQMYYLYRAAVQGHPIGQYNYALVLSYNIPFYSKYYDLDKAIYWMELAAKNGSADAVNKLRELYSIKNKK